VTREVWVVRLPRGIEATWLPESCPDCGAPSEMLTPESAAEMAGVSPRTVYRWVETGRVHFTERPDGRLFVCLTSLHGARA
jgi:excisionase family DNA binding protein